VKSGTVTIAFVPSRKSGRARNDARSIPITFPSSAGDGEEARKTSRPLSHQRRSSVWGNLTETSQ
jgi:hypothetical protein